MSVLLVVPGLISLFLVLRGRIETAFLSVFLPCLLLLPENYSFRIPHFTPLTAAEFALIPLGVVGLSRWLRGRSFALMDILVLLYAASVSLSEILHAHILNDAILSAINVVVTMVFAYMVGRKLIEPDLRLATVRRFVVLVLLDFTPGLWEWRMSQSLYGIFGHRVLGLTNIGESVQRRNGRGRMGEVFNGSEPGGIAFAMTFCLNAWLAYLRKVKAPVKLGKTLTKLENYHVAGLVLILCVWFTQARGPLVALAAGYFILHMSLSKNIKRNVKLRTFVIAVLLVGGYMGTSAYIDTYTSVATAQNEQQGSAIYRREMNRIYAPIAEAGGWTGWGIGGIPHVEGKMSIDNHYLLVHLAWGRLGYYLFLMIALENMRVLVVRSWQFKTMQDRAFAFSMLAAMTVLWIALVTVFLGGQLPEISFLLIGWGQSLVPGKPSAAPVAGAASPSRVPLPAGITGTRG